MIDEFMTLGQVQGLVQANLCREVSRATIYRWRQALNFTNPPYIQFHVDSLVHFGKLVGVGVSPERARDLTIEHMESRK